jgi:hypothetical protein
MESKQTKNNDDPMTDVVVGAATGSSSFREYRLSREFEIRLVFLL